MLLSVGPYRAMILLFNLILYNSEDVYGDGSDIPGGQKDNDIEKVVFLHRVLSSCFLYSSYSTKTSIPICLLNLFFLMSQVGFFPGLNKMGKNVILDTLSHISYLLLRVKK